MPLDPKHVKEVFLAAAEKINSEDRNAFLAEACGSDAELRHRVEGLLEAHDASGAVAAEEQRRVAALQRNGLRRMRDDAALRVARAERQRP